MSAIGVWLVLGLSGPASATTCDPQAAWASLRAYDSGARDAYLCLAGHPDGAAILTAALDAEPAVPSEAGPSDAGGDPSPLTPEDAETPRYLYALGAAYARTGDRANAMRTLRAARDLAATWKQTDLLARIERDLKTLEQP